VNTRGNPGENKLCALAASIVGGRGVRGREENEVLEWGEAQARKRGPGRKSSVKAKKRREPENILCQEKEIVKYRHRRKI